MLLGLPTNTILAVNRSTIPPLFSKTGSLCRLNDAVLLLGSVTPFHGSTQGESVVVLQAILLLLVEPVIGWFLFAYSAAKAYINRYKILWIKALRIIGLLSLYFLFKQCRGLVLSRRAP